MNHRSHNLTIAAALIAGPILGTAGAITEDPVLRQMLYSIDAVLLVAAGALLTMRYFRTGQDLIAAGFLVFTLGESLLLSGDPASFPGTLALWAAGLVMVSIPRAFPLWGRLSGIAAGVLFLLAAGMIVSGDALTPASSPLPNAAYPFLLASFVGWIVDVLRKPEEE